MAHSGGPKLPKVAQSRLSQKSLQIPPGLHTWACSSHESSQIADALQKMRSSVDLPGR